MASAFATMAVLNPKCLSLINNKLPSPPQFPPKPLSLQNARIHLSAGMALAFATIATLETALAVQQITEGDSRGQLLQIVVTLALLWVVYKYNILHPALNQINRMRSD